MGQQREAISPGLVVVVCCSQVDQVSINIDQLGLRCVLSSGEKGMGRRTRAPYHRLIDSD